MFRRFLLACAVTANALVTSAAPITRSSPIAITTDGRRVIAVNPDSESVSIVDSLSRAVTEIPTCRGPQTVSPMEGSSRVLVACRDGAIVIVDIDVARVVARRNLGTELFGAVSSGTLAYVTAPGASRLYVLSATSLDPITDMATGAQPRGLALAGGHLYVTHFSSGMLTVIDTAALRVERKIATGLDSNLSQSIWIAAARVYLPQTRSNSSNPALLFDTTVFPIVSVIDLVAGENLPRERIAIDIADRPSNMPLDTVLTSGGKLYVVNAGSDDVSVIDLARRTAVAHLQVGSNPRGIALSPDEQTAWVVNTLGGSISIIDTLSDRVTATIPITKIPLPPDVLNGKILFHTSARTSLAKDHWISCATCHFDGGADGRTWFFRDGPRNTPALFGVGETLPIHWSGDLDELQDVESTIRTVQAGTGLAEGASNCEPACNLGPPNAGRSKDLDDLAAFMRALRPPAREVLPTDSSRRGSLLFFDVRVGCASCHGPPLYTDRQKHDVGTGQGLLERKGSSFDTPSLRGVEGTAPYFHDGSAATLLEVVKAASGQHGDTRMLTDSERSDLVEFLRTIDFATPRRRTARK